MSGDPYVGIGRVARVSHLARQLAPRLERAALADRRQAALEPDWNRPLCLFAELSQFVDSAGLRGSARPRPLALAAGVARIARDGCAGIATTGRRHASRLRDATAPILLLVGRALE